MKFISIKMFSICGNTFKNVHKTFVHFDTEDMTGYLGPGNLGLNTASRSGTSRDVLG